MEFTYSLGANASFTLTAHAVYLPIPRIEIVGPQGVQASFDWQGVGDDHGNVVPVTLEGIDALLEIWPVFEAFQTKYVAKGLILEADKNVSAPSPSGPSAGAKAIAPPVSGAAKTARHG